MRRLTISPLTKASRSPSKGTYSGSSHTWAAIHILLGIPWILIGCRTIHRKNVNKNNIATLSLYGIPMKTINIQVSKCMVNKTNTQFNTSPNIKRQIWLSTDILVYLCTHRLIGEHMKPYSLHTLQVLEQRNTPQYFGCP